MGWGAGGGIQEGGDTCILMADSHRCTAETNTLQRNYTPIKNKLIKKEKKDVVAIRFFPQEKDHDI